MNSGANFTDLILFIVLPYLAMFTFFLVSIWRYTGLKFTYSTLSSQFLENNHHFWGMVPFHYGIIIVLLGHIVAFLVPEELLLFNRVAIRLYILEISALAFGLLSLIGLASIIVRRFTDSKIRTVTSTVDWIVLGLLLVQIAAGVGVAIFNRWGSSWFASAMSPYLWSLVFFRPEIEFVSGLSFWVKLHIVNAFLLIGFLPFTRLVHILVIPNPYLWRKPQVVRWYRLRGKPLPVKSHTGRR